MKKTKLFKNGQSQAVRLPKEFRFEGKEVYVKKVENTIVLFSVKNPWELLIKSLDEFSDDFMATRDQSGHQDRESF